MFVTNCFASESSFRWLIYVCATLLGVSKKQKGIHNENRIAQRDKHSIAHTRHSDGSLPWWWTELNLLSQCYAFVLKKVKQKVQVNKARSSGSNKNKKQNKPISSRFLICFSWWSFNMDDSMVMMLLLLLGNKEVKMCHLNDDLKWSEGDSNAIALKYIQNCCSCHKNTLLTYRFVNTPLGVNSVSAGTVEIDKLVIWFELKWTFPTVDRAGLFVFCGCHLKMWSSLLSGFFHSQEKKLTGIR